MAGLVIALTVMFMCAFCAIGDLAIEQEKTAIPEPTEMTVKNNPYTLSDNKGKKSSYHVKPQILGNCSACGWPVYEGDRYERTDNGLWHQDCKQEEEDSH
jgi:ribosomal protein L37E